MPASSTSRMSNSWRARRFDATTWWPLDGEDGLGGTARRAYRRRPPRSPGSAGSVPAVLALPDPIRLELLAHSFAGLPDEACGLIAARPGGDVVERFYPCG